MNPRNDPAESESNDGDQEILPGVITRISSQRRAHGRYAVEIDGRGGLTLAEEVIVRANLQVGDALDAERISALLAEDETARAVEAALSFVAYRPRSEQEVRDRLRRGKFSAAAIDRALARLYEWRYLDDADFARRWVENRASQRPRGRRMLQLELRRKGIAAETAAEAIDEADLDELAAATDLARRQLAKYAGVDEAAARRRLGAFLARRGYGYDIVRAALERVAGEAEDQDESPVD
jgi:regulatory protein